MNKVVSMHACYYTRRETTVELAACGRVQVKISEPRRCWFRVFSIHSRVRSFLAMKISIFQRCQRRRRREAGNLSADDA